MPKFSENGKYACCSKAHFLTAMQKSPKSCTLCQQTTTAVWRSDRETKSVVCNGCYNKKYPRAVLPPQDLPAEDLPAQDLLAVIPQDLPAQDLPAQDVLAVLQHKIFQHKIIRQWEIMFKGMFHMRACAGDHMDRPGESVYLVSSQVGLLDCCPGHLTQEVAKKVRDKGYVPLFLGGGTTPIVQVNDTNLHAQVAQTLLQYEVDWALRERERQFD